MLPDLPSRLRFPVATRNGNTIRKIKKVFEKSFREMQGPRFMKKLGGEAAEIVRRRTRLGFGVEENGGIRKPLKPLADSYVKQRRGELAFFTRKDGTVVPFKPKVRPILSRKTRPKKSNLTRFGFMLDSLKEQVKGLGKVQVTPTGTRPDGLTNEEVSEFVSDERPYLNLSNNEIKQIEISTSDEFEKIIKKNLTKL